MSLPDPQSEERDDKQNNEQNQSGDFVGGDKVEGDKIGRDKYSVGNISDSKAVGIGETVNIDYQETNIVAGKVDPVEGLFHITFPRSLRFQGRETELTTLHQLLQSNRNVGINSKQLAGVTGMGGIGKTQLAVEYAHRHQTDYPGGIFLVNATENIGIQLVEIADLFRLQPADPSSPDRTGQMISAIADYLRTRPQTLLIFDNVDNPDQLLRTRFGPGLTLTALGGTLLITTRTRQLPEQMKAFSLDTLENDPAAARAIITNARAGLNDDPMLDELCERMGYLPLGLNLAASVLRELDDLTIADYLAELNQMGLDDLTAEAEVEKPEDYAYAGLTPVLKRQWEQLQAEDKNGDAGKLFQVAGQLGEAAFIPIARLSLLANVADTSKIRRPLSKAVDRLETLYFIELLNEATIRLHPLVRDFAESRTPEDGRGEFRNECANNMADAYWGLERLVDEIYARGVGEVQEDLLIGLTLFDPNAPISSLHNLETLNRLLQREAHSLRPGSTKIYIAQQLAYRIADRSLKVLKLSAKALISKTQAPVFECKWTNRKESLAIRRTLLGHKSDVNAEMVFDEGFKAISASHDRTIKVWNLLTGEEEKTLLGHQSSVTSAAVFDEGCKAISASRDKTLIIWNLQTGNASITLRGHEHWVRMVTVFNMGHKAISASYDNTLLIWNLQTGILEQRLVGHNSRVNAVTVFDEGKKAISASSDNSLVIWNLQTGMLEQKLVGHSSRVNAVAVFDEGRKAISASWDGTLIVWNLQSGQRELQLTEHDSRVNAVLVFDKDRKAISASSDNTILVWNLHTGEAEQRLYGHEESVNAVAVFDKGKKAISASSDSRLIIWDLQTEESELLRHGNDSRVDKIAVYDEGRKAISASSDNSLLIWNLQTGIAEHRLLGHNSSIQILVVFSNGQNAISGSPDQLFLWNLQNGEAEYQRRVRGHDEFYYEVMSLAQSIAGNRNFHVVKPATQFNVANQLGSNMFRAIQTSGGQEIVVQDLNTGKDLASIVLDGAMTCVDVHEGDNGVTVVAGDAGGGVYCLEYIEPRS